MHNKNKERSNNTLSDKKKQNKERDKYKNSKGWKQLKRKGHNNKNNNNEGKFDKIIKDKCKNTN